MKILVLSDSHSALRFMQMCAQVLKPDLVIHLGDYFQDGMTLRDDFRDGRLIQVPGNCDSYSGVPGCPFTQLHEIGGLRFFMTHGHKQNVKSGTDRLLREAREAGADVVLYGHTHVPDLRHEEDLWVLNPGSCGYFGGTAGLIEIQEGQIRDVRLIHDTDLLDK